MPVFTNAVHEKKYVDEEAYQDLLRTYISVTRVFAAVIEQNGGELIVPRAALESVPDGEAEIVRFDQPWEDVMTFRLRKL